MFKIPDEIKLFAFDLDGTLYVGDNPVPGAVELVDKLRRNYQVVFFTNNSSKTRQEIFDKLNRLGIKCELGEVYATSTATAMYLEEAGIDNVFVFGSDGFRKEIESRGISTVNDASADNVVVGHDREINYIKIQTALSILLKGGKFVVCNEDGYFPAGNGIYLPGCGAMVGAVKGASEKNPDFIVGKPNTYILTRIARKYKVDKDEIMVVGDSCGSDIKMAMNFGCHSVLISSEDHEETGKMQVVENLHQMQEGL